MALTIRWFEGARNDLARIIAYISEDNPSAARNLRDRIEQSVLPATDHPYMFRGGRVPGTREIVAHPNYIVIYRVSESEIQVVQVVHAARQYP